MMESGYRQDERGRSPAALVSEGVTIQRYPMSILVGAPGRSHDTAEAQVLSRRREAHAQLRLARQLRASLEAAVHRSSESPPPPAHPTVTTTENSDAASGSNANGGSRKRAALPPIQAWARQVMGSVLPEIRRLALLTEAVVSSGNSSLTGTIADVNTFVPPSGSHCYDDMQEEDRRARVEQAAQVVYGQLRRWARERNPVSVYSPPTPPPPPILPAASDTDQFLSQNDQDEPPSLPLLDEPAAATTDEETESENEESENESEEGDPFSRWRRKHAGKKKKSLAKAKQTETISAASPESKSITRKRPPEKDQDDGEMDAEEAVVLRPKKKRTKAGNKNTKLKDTREHILMSNPLKKPLSSKEDAQISASASVQKRRKPVTKKSPATNKVSTKNRKAANSEGADAEDGGLEKNRTDTADGSEKKKDSMPKPPQKKKTLSMDKVKRRKPSSQPRKCHDCQKPGIYYFRRCHFWFANGTKCGKTYCRECLISTYSQTAAENWETIGGDIDWHCPACQGVCQCKSCQRERKRADRKTSKETRTKSRTSAGFYSLKQSAFM